MKAVKIILAINLVSLTTLSSIVLSQRITGTEAIFYTGLFICSAFGITQLFVNIKITIKKAKMKKLITAIVTAVVNEFSNFFAGTARLDSNIL